MRVGTDSFQGVSGPSYHPDAEGAPAASAGGVPGGGDAGSNRVRYRYRLRAAYWQTGPQPDCATTLPQKCGTSSYRYRCRPRQSGRSAETWRAPRLWRPWPASLAGGAGARPDHPINGHQFSRPRPTRGSVASTDNGHGLTLSSPSSPRGGAGRRGRWRRVNDAIVVSQDVAGVVIRRRTRPFW